MIAKENLLKQSTATMANTLKNKLQNIPPQLLLVFASQTRQKVLHQSAHDEIKIIKNTFGLTTPIFGMYTCGEIISQQNKLIFENAHLSLTAIL